jgi:putative signal recognition particle protein
MRLGEIKDINYKLKGDSQMKYILIILFIATSVTLRARINNQGTNTLSFITNNKIKYEIVLVACDTCVPIRNIGYRINLVMTARQKAIIEKINDETWLKLLENPSKDFATNIILYSLYKKDAIIFFEYKDVYDWKRARKQKDARYWKKLFMRQKKLSSNKE